MAKRDGRVSTIKPTKEKRIGGTVDSPTKNPTIYNIIRWFAGPMGQTTRRPSVWYSKYFFFTISYRFRALKTLYFNFCNFIKNKLKGVLQRFYEKKNNTWNIRRLVDESFFPSAQRTSLYIVDWAYNSTMKIWPVRCDDISWKKCTWLKFCHIGVLCCRLKLDCLSFS